MRILFGGSFNPIHVGHLIIAQDVAETFKTKIVFVPAYIQPLKERLLLPDWLRLQLIEESIKDNSLFSVWDYEIKRKRISYTVETLRYYVRTFKEKPLIMMGYDSFNEFNLWKEPREILRLSRLIVVKRAGYKLKMDEVLRELNVKPKTVEVSPGQSTTPDADIVIFNGRNIEISSTEIRKRLKFHQSIRYFLTEEAGRKLWRWHVQQNGLRGYTR